MMTCLLIYCVVWTATFCCATYFRPSLVHMNAPDGVTAQGDVTSDADLSMATEYGNWGHQR